MARGSTGNVVSALASLFILGLGQLMHGRLIAAMFYLLLTVFLWVITSSHPGILGHAVACLDATVWKGSISKSL